MFARLLLLVASTGGCTMAAGARVGGGVARSTKPQALTSPIGEGTSMADASNSQEWVELELSGGYRYARGILVLGGGVSHTRFRRTDGTAFPIYAMDDNFQARAGGGLSLVSPTFYGFRVAPYLLYSSNFGTLYNGADSTREYGLDLEWARPISGRTESVFVVGAALITETGNADAELGGFGSQDGEFTVEGAMITFGWHLGLDFSKEDN
ncbi:hypothetical protein BH11MYX3_BH11MYX3_29770 [soil metagenome]